MPKLKPPIAALLANCLLIEFTDGDDAMTIADGGVVTFAQSPVFPDGSLAVIDLDIDGATDIGAAVADADLFIIDDGANGTNRKVTAARVKTYMGAEGGAFSLDNLDIDGATDIGAAIVDADLFIVDDGAGGTNRKTTAARVLTYIESSITTTGALNSGSITSGFGAIDNGTSNIRSATITAETAFVPDAANGATLGTTSLEFADLFLHDGAQILFGADQDVLLTHVADAGLTLKTATTSDDTQATLTLQTGDTDIAANDVIGQLHFQAPDEGTGTDAILVAAGIAAISEGNFAADNNATSLVFKTGASEAAAEKMRIDSSGNLFVATTTEASDDVGHALLASGAAYHTADGTYVGLFNRKSSDGEVVQIRKDNTVVGSINARSTFTNLEIGSLGTGLSGTSSHTILPSINNARSDNTNDFGSSSYRYKDLYLGGGLLVGGTGTANKLDDYEEGTWTPVCRNANYSNGTVIAIYTPTASYTKIGRIVNVQFTIRRNDGASLSDVLFVTGLPFTSSSSAMDANINGGVWVDNSSGDKMGFVNMGASVSHMAFRKSDIEDASIASDEWINGRYIYGGATYIV